MPLTQWPPCRTHVPMLRLPEIIGSDSELVCRERSPGASRYRSRLSSNITGTSGYQEVESGPQIAARPFRKDRPPWPAGSITFPIVVACVASLRASVGSRIFRQGGRTSSRASRKPNNGVVTSHYGQFSGTNRKDLRNQILHQHVRLDQGALEQPFVASVELEQGPNANRSQIPALAAKRKTALGPDFWSLQSWVKAHSLHSWRIRWEKSPKRTDIVTQLPGWHSTPAWPRESSSTELQRFLGAAQLQPPRAK